LLRAGDGGVAGFGGDGSLLFGLSQAGESRLVGRLTVRGGVIRVRAHADGEVLRLAVGQRRNSGGSRIETTGLSVDGAGRAGHGAA
jgi:hypothetical protein